MKKVSVVCKLAECPCHMELEWVRLERNVESRLVNGPIVEQCDAGTLVAIDIFPRAYSALNR